MSTFNVDHGKEVQRNYFIRQQSFKELDTHTDCEHATGEQLNTDDLYPTIMKPTD